MQFHPQFLAAARACLPALPGVIVFAAISGVAMVAAGMPHYLAMTMSVLVYAGQAQLAALQLVSSGSPLAIAIAAGLVINLRFSIYSLSMAPFLSGAPARRKAALAYLLSDNGYALAIQSFERLPDPADKVWYYLGGAAAIWVAWQAGTLAGIFLGTRIPAGWQLEFSIVLTFLAMVIPTIRDRAVAIAALAAGVTAVIAWPLPLRSGLIVAVAAGIVAGMLAEKWK